MANEKEKAFGLENLKSCEGYLPKFINAKTSVGIDKILSDAQKKLLPDVIGNKKKALNYCDFSILYHKDRKLPFVVAYNIDGSQKANQASRPTFRIDPRIDEEIQLNDDFYDLEKKFTEFEIGHMASNNEMGRGKKGILKAYQTFHFTNSSPQSEVLNTGLWKGLESYIIKEAGNVVKNKKVCVFTGPILKPDDPPYVHQKSFKVPLVFFKVVVFAHSTGLYSTAFIISHEKKLIEHKLIKPPKKPARIVRGEPAFTNYPYKEVFQINLSQLESFTKLNFSWRGVKPLIVPERPNALKVVKSVMNAGEAKKRITRGGVSDENLILTNELSDADIRSGDFQLTMVLPK